MSSTICMVSDANWIEQAENVCRQIRNLGRSERICILLLGSVPQFHKENLVNLAVETRCADEPFWPMGIPKTGLKLWLPTFFNSDTYFLMDSDLIILSEVFFDAFATVPKKMKLVRESTVKWRKGRKGITPDHHAAIIGRSILQTGVMSFDRAFWHAHFEGILDCILSDASDFGDMAAVNLFMAYNPQLLEPVSEETCLVLRPTGTGPSTKAHLPRTATNGTEMFYDGRRVLSIHYTYSNGAVCDYEDILRMVDQNGLRL